MPKLTGTTIVVNPTTYSAEVLLAGSELPDWASGLVGDHLLDEPHLVAEPELQAPAPADTEPAEPVTEPAPAEPEPQAPVTTEPASAEPAPAAPEAPKPARRRASK